MQKIKWTKNKSKFDKCLKNENKSCNIKLKMKFMPNKIILEKRVVFVVISLTCYLMLFFVGFLFAFLTPKSDFSRTVALYSWVLVNVLFFVWLIFYCFYPDFISIENLGGKTTINNHQKDFFLGRKKQKLKISENDYFIKIKEQTRSGCYYKLGLIKNSQQIILGKAAFSDSKIDKILQQIRLIRDQKNLKFGVDNQEYEQVNYWQNTFKNMFQITILILVYIALPMFLVAISNLI